MNQDSHSFGSLNNPVNCVNRKQNADSVIHGRLWREKKETATKTTASSTATHCDARNSIVYSEKSRRVNHLLSA